MCCNKKYGCLYVRFGLNACTCTCIWLSWDQDNSCKITIRHESCKIVRVSDATLPLSSLTHANTGKEIDDFLACFFYILGKSNPPPLPTFKTHVWERCFWNIYMKSSVSSVFSVTRTVSVSCCEFSSHCSWFLLKLTERQSAWPIYTQFQTLLISCWTHSFEIKTNQSSPSLNEINHK